MKFALQCATHKTVAIQNVILVEIWQHFIFRLKKHSHCLKYYFVIELNPFCVLQIWNIEKVQKIGRIIEALIGMRFIFRVDCFRRAHSTRAY